MMMTRLLLGVFAVLSRHMFAEGAKFSYCDSLRTYVEGFEHPKTDPRRYCQVNSTSTVRWTVVSKTGATRYLGTCHGPDNCTTPYSSSELVLEQERVYSRMDFHKYDSRFSGELTCQETLIDGTVSTDVCQMNFARVCFRSKHQFDFTENASSVITCDNAPYNTSTVTWTLVTTSGHTLDLGTCTDVNNCSSPHAPAFTLKRTSRYSSQLHVQNIDRNRGGQLSCSYLYNGSKETDSATLNIFDQPTVTNCLAEVHLHNWSTVFSCDVSKAFSSAGQYEFSVSEEFMFRTHLGFTFLSGQVFDGRRSFRDVMTPYTHSSDNRVYYRGRLTFSWPLSADQGRYTRLKVLVFYSLDQYITTYIDYKANVTRPSQPIHNCSGMNYIPETGVVSCVCTADYLGFPAGRLVWLLGNISIATGDYGVTQLTFPSGKVSRQHERMMVTCQLDWVQPIVTEFERLVAYGPDIVTLQVIQSHDVNNSVVVHVSSHVTEMKPMTSDMVLWGGLCQGQQGFTCTLTPRSAAEVDGKPVTCRVTNAANNGHSAEVSVVIRISGHQGSAQAQTKRDHLQWTSVSVGIALGIVLIALVVVIIIFCRRGKPSGNPTQDSPKTKTPDNDNASYFTTLNLPEVTKTNMNGVQLDVTCPSGGHQGHDNASNGGQGVHM